MLNSVNLNAGSKLVVGHGAMFPWHEGEILENKDGVLLVQWDDEQRTQESVEVSRVQFGRSMNGSGIGIFPLDVFMAM